LHTIMLIMQVFTLK